MEPQLHTALLVQENVEPPLSFSFKKLLRFLGPGLLMSIAYVDPGNLESDIQVGARTGYVLLWLLLASTGMGFLVQMQAAKLGVVTGQHLAEHCRQQYPALPRYLLWIMAEVALIGADIQEVIGSAIAISLLSRGAIPLWAGVLITAIDSFVLLFIEQLGVRLLEGFFGLLIAVMVAAFGFMYYKADVPTAEVVGGFLLPRLPAKDLPPAVGLVGALIMPHNIYLHSALVKTRKLMTKTKGEKKEALMYFGIESALSLLSAVFINLFVVAVIARGFFGREDLPDIGLENAGTFLASTYGQAAEYIWAIGLLAAGQSSTMTGTYTGQFIMSGYLNLKVSPWVRIMITRATSIVPTLAVALAFQGSGAMDTLNQSLNLLQSIQLPFALIPVLTFASSRSIMGEFANGLPTKVAVWGVAGLVILINSSLLYQGVMVSAGAEIRVWLAPVLGPFVVMYLVFVVYLTLVHSRYGVLLPRCLQAQRGELAGCGSDSEEVEGDKHCNCSCEHVVQQPGSLDVKSAGNNGACCDAKLPLLAGHPECTQVTG